MVEPLLGKCRSMEFVNAADCKGDTALHIAAGEGNKQVMKLLLKCSADNAPKNNVS